MGVQNNQPKPITRMTKEVKGILSNLLEEGVCYYLARWENIGYCAEHDYDGHHADFEPSCEDCQEIRETMLNYERANEVAMFITKKLNLEA